ncbi:MAG: T9SS type A sorting domain-containing protein, partial [candidate division Zixibacteria bacterium]|nr:T9SS type A sorting domain-containing protein [candidate division Zixibacteria bacterium]
IIDVNSNLDDDYPSIVFAVSCLVGFPEPNSYGRLGVDLLTKPGFGSSAGVLSASRSAAVSVDWPTNPGGAGSFVYDFNRFLIVESRKVGEAIYDAKFYVHDNFGWEDWFYEYKNLYDYNLYGDPALVQPGVAGSPLDCDMTIHTLRVPSVNADIQFDLTVENVGSTTFNTGLFAELYPVIGDCVNGTNFDFDLKSRLTSEPLTPGGTFTGYYNFHVDSVAGSFELASLNIGIGGSDDEWECFCCDEFYFTRSWNRQGGSSGNIWRNPEWNELGDEIIPYSTSLGQNYPNPFNASTTISYTLSSTSDVNLEVYNLLGQKIETLINGEVEAGNHSITWDASSLSSGIYFSKLTVGNFVSTRKLNLLK